jgi:hypothetical protein
MGVSDLLDKISFTDELGQSTPLDPLPVEINIVDNPDQVLLWRGYWAWHEAQSFLSLIRVRKMQYQRMQAKLASGKVVQSSGVERGAVRVQTRGEQVFEGPVEYVLQHAFSYKRINGKVSPL